MTSFDQYIGYMNDGLDAQAHSIDLNTFSDRELDRVYEAEVNDWNDTEPFVCGGVGDVSIPFWVAQLGRDKVLESIKEKRP